MTMKRICRVVFLLNVITITLAVRLSLWKRAACTIPTGMQGKCQCQYNVVKCSDLNIIQPITGGSSPVRLEVSNSVLTITDNSFKNWNLTDVVLENCSLTDSSFTSNSFQGLYDKLKVLSLAHNHLTQLPLVLSKFSNIQDLDVSGNPIDENHFNEDILRDIGDTLTRFVFGTEITDTSLQQWPKTLKHLQKLQELTLTASSISIMPSHAFHGFEGTLTNLTIAHTKLRSVPLALSRLRYLEELHFDHNSNVGDYGVRIPILKGYLPYLLRMSLKDDNITTFPEVLKSFERLDKLEMDENNLKFVSDKSASAVANISSLSLKNSGITRIPGAIQDITKLNALDLSNNKIHAIETNDLKESYNLYILTLNDNPILYISDQAFNSQSLLRRLEMKNVKIKRVPCAIENMLRNHHRGHIVIDLSGNKIECNCGLRWLYETKLFASRSLGLRFNVIGECDTISSTIQAYIDNQLQYCPAGVTCSDSE